MVRVSAVFIAACMMLICASFGAVLYLSLGLSMTEAFVAAIAALTGMAVCTVAASNADRHRASSAQLVELSRGVTELARQTVELDRRVAATEGKVADAVEQAATAAPFAAEMGVLMKQLAESVIAHELVLQERVNLLLAGAARAPSAPGSTAARQYHPYPPEHDPATARPPAFGPIRGAASDADMSAPLAGAADAEGFPNTPSALKSLTAEEAIGVIREAIEANRIEFFLQPILTLPQRKVRFYEASAQLRTADGELIAASDFMGVAEAGGLMPRIDVLTLFRCIQIARRLMSKHRDLALFCNLSASTLAQGEFFAQLTEFMEANRAIAPALVIEIAQTTCRKIGPIESESLLALIGWGFRFSMNDVRDLQFEPRSLADRGFRFIKVPAGLLLNRRSAGAADIDAADLAGLLIRFGIDLIAEKIESEATVANLLDRGVKFGQGGLFSPPRPVRADLLQAAVDVAMPAKAEERPPRRETEGVGPGASPSLKAFDPHPGALQRPVARTAAVK